MPGCHNVPAGNTDEQVEFPLTVPLLPFQVEEVLLPGDPGLRLQPSLPLMQTAT